jgi:hypothetical protein
MHERFTLRIKYLEETADELARKVGWWEIKYRMRKLLTSDPSTPVTNEGPIG